MKAALTRFLHVFMAVVVLLSSMGFGLVDHTCQMRGKRTYLIHQHSEACQMRPADIAEQVTGPVIRRTACCVEKARYEKIDIGSSLSHGLTNINTVAEEFGASFTAAFTTVSGLFVAYSASLSAAVCDPSAPPFGRTLLVFVQSFLI